MKRTTNYDLPTWEKTDRVLMSDFNDMTGKIDGALAQKARFASGTYKGTGESGAAANRKLTFDFAPKLLVIMQGDGEVNCRMTVAPPAAHTRVYKNVGTNSFVSADVTWEGNSVSLSFSSSDDYVCLNHINTVYCYFAFG